MLDAVENETPSLVQEDCDVVGKKKRRKFKGPAGRRIDSPAIQPKLFSDSSNIVVVPNPAEKKPKKKFSEKNEKAEVASKTRALTSFFSPLQNSSSMKKESVASLSEEERKTKLILIYTNRVERALNTFDKITLLKVIKEIVKLPEEDIEKIPNPFVKFVVKRQYMHLKNKNAMKNMTTDEKKVYKKEKCLKVEGNKEFEALIIQFLSGKREDMLYELKPFYDVPLIKLNSNVACHLFGHCLSLTEFLNTFRELLGYELSFSAEYLMEELKSGKSGFQKCIGYVLKAFLHFLVADGYKKKCKQLQSYAQRTYAPGLNRILKLTQLVLLDDVYSEESDDCEQKTTEKEENNTIGGRSCIRYNADVERAVEQLEDVDFFWNLSISSQVIIMEILMDKIIDSVSFRKYLDSSKEIRDRAVQEKKDIEDTMQKVQKDIEQIQSHFLEVETCLTRKQTRELAENERLKCEKASELELLRDKLLEQDEHIKEAETISNYGQEASYSSKDCSLEEKVSENTENIGARTTDGKQSKKNFTTFLTSLNENLFGRPPDNSINRKAYWRVVKTEKELNLLLDCLGKGVREEKLSASIYQQLGQILESFRNSNEVKVNNVVQTFDVADSLESLSDAKADEFVEIPEQVSM